MAFFYNAETREPISVMYIASSRRGRAVLSAGKPLLMDMRVPAMVITGPGRAVAVSAMNPRSGDYYWEFSDLSEGSLITAVDGQARPLAKMSVKRVAGLKSYQAIDRRFNKRGMHIDLDSHIDYICYASPILGEGIAFRPKSKNTFESAIKQTQLFHHDDRSDHFGRLAASATVGEGYREVSTPSLHVAASSFISSVHIDSYAFMIHGPDGVATISPDVGQHIFDELLFRMPMPWLRRKGMTFLASVLQSLHPVLPHSANRYRPILGLRFEAGGTDARDLRAGEPRFTVESTYDVGQGTKKHYQHTAVLRLLSGGDPDRSPDWTLRLKAQVLCRDVLCRTREESVGLYFTSGGKE